MRGLIETAIYVGQIGLIYYILTRPRTKKFVFEDHKDFCAGASLTWLFMWICISDSENLTNSEILIFSGIAVVSISLLCYLIADTRKGVKRFFYDENKGFWRGVFVMWLFMGCFGQEIGSSIPSTRGIAIFLADIIHSLPK